MLQATVPEPPTYNIETNAFCLHIAFVHFTRLS